MTNPTLTIGIPAYNEAANIGKLIHQIQRQVFTSVDLACIHIITDSPTDETPQIVDSIAKRDARIIHQKGKERRGKSSRLSQLFKANTSELFISLDADVSLADPHTLQHLITPLLEDGTIGLTTANNQPVPASDSFEAAMNSLFKSWYYARKNYNHGDNIYNHQGMAFATRHDVTAIIRIPQAVIADQHFIYLSIKRMGYNMKFVADAIIYFRSPTNKDDFICQGRRSIEEKSQLHQYLRFSQTSEFYLPRTNIYIGIFHQLLHAPISTIRGILYHFQLRQYLNHHHLPQTQATWKPINSTKYIPRHALARTR